jgi:hypothetical protein
VSRWYGAATVRNSPRIFVPDDIKSENIFPKSRQLLSEHPAVVSLGQDAVAYVLAQSTYKYMYEIGLLETRFVIDCALKISNRQIAEQASDSDRLEAIAVVIDEGYHAYVALDFIIQLKAKSGIKPLLVPETNGNLDAVRRGYLALPEAMHGAYQLLATCLAEHTLTKDLLSIGREKEATRTFTRVMTDHVSDEGRHANYFVRMLQAYWKTLDSHTQDTIGTFLPGYLKDYLAADTERNFDRLVLEQLPLSARTVAQVLQDTHAAYLASAQAYIATTTANLVRLLNRHGVLDRPLVRKAFVHAGLLTS